MKLYAKIFLEVLPILVGIGLTYLFWHNNILLAAIYILATTIVLALKKYPGDVEAFFVGIIVGLIVETIGTSISGYQSFTNPDFLGIPVWLPISWGYGLMMMKRIGIIIYEGRR